MNHKPIESRETTTAELRVRKPLVTHEEPAAEVRPTPPQNGRWITRAAQAFARRLRNGSREESV